MLVILAEKCCVRLRKIFTQKINCFDITKYYPNIMKSQTQLRQNGKNFFNKKIPNFRNRNNNKSVDEDVRAHDFVL